MRAEPIIAEILIFDETCIQPDKDNTPQCKGVLKKIIYKCNGTTGHQAR